MAETALKQAVRKGYGHDLTGRRFGNVHVYGIACFGKKCCVRMQEDQGH